MATISPREAVIDAVLRLVQAIEDHDASLLASALTADTTLDMSGLSVITGQPVPVLKGIQMATVGLLEHGVGKMDTGHVASNFRVQIKQDGVAELSLMMIAHHYRKGEGSMAEKRGLAAGNRWKMEVVEAGDGLWKVRKAEIRNLWCEGDPAVFGP